MPRDAGILSAYLLLGLVLLGLSVQCAATPPGSSGDRFALDGVDLPAGSSAESTIRAILERAPADRPRASITVDYPLPESVFPPDIVAPTVAWQDPEPAAGLWLVDVAFDGAAGHLYVLSNGAREEREVDARCVTDEHPYVAPEYPATARAWTPGRELWETIKSLSVERNAVISILGIAGSVERPADGEIVSRGSVRIGTSRDPVGATIFYRDVPLMPTKTEKGVIQPLDKSMFPLVQWRLRDISRPAAPVVMQQLPTCANCHSFSADGETLAMDMDGPGGDKGAYVVKQISPRMELDREDVFTWNSFPGLAEGKTSFGLFARISPDGRYVLTTLNEDIFVTNFPDIQFIQTFYPTRGILVWYDRETGEIRPLPGADDPEFVHANPVWTPDGETVVFLRARARPAYSPGPRPERANDPRETQIRFDMYRIPFDDGRGGAARPIPGGSDNGMSNSFPKVSPDGKWIVFVQARNGLMLRPDSELYIIPVEGGEARRMRCNTERMNSWHSWSPNSRWLVFSSKQNGPYTEMFLTHVDEDGNDTPPILVPNSTAANRAVNLPEFVNIAADGLEQILVPAADHRRYLERGRDFKDAGKLEQAIAELETSLQLREDYWDTHLTLADALALDGRSAESIEHYLRALELNPGHFSATNNLAVALRRSGRYDDALRTFDAALQLRPRSAATHYSLGKTLAAAGDPVGALQHLARATELDPELDGPDLESALILARRGDAAGAERHFERALELDPESYLAQHQWGLALSRWKRIAEAIEHYREALRIDPDYYPACDSLARVLAADADPAIRNPDEAVRLAQLACERTDHTNPVYLHTLAVAYAAAERFDDAVRVAEKAAELARRENRAGLAREIESHLALFRSGKALRIGG